jgi:hypothetical protein
MLGAADRENSSGLQDAGPVDSPKLTFSAHEVGIVEGPDQRESNSYQERGIKCTTALHGNRWRTRITSFGRRSAAFRFCPTANPGRFVPKTHAIKGWRLFLQFDIDGRFSLPFDSGSTLSIFQCIQHDDAFEALDTKSPKPHERLPDNYWLHSNYAIFFAAPGQQHQLAEREPFLKHSKIITNPEVEPHARSIEALNYKNIKIGGFPFWLQKPKRWHCSCGAKMEFLCSIPSNLPFPRNEGSPRQPNGRADSYFLFLGLSTYVFACRARCHPRAVVAVRQN